MSDIENLVDEEGENQAVRAFLMYYGGGNATCPIISMRAHLARSGFDGCWPEWAAAPNSTTLTKAGAQLWIRHLFSLEGRTASTIPASEAGELPPLPKVGPICYAMVADIQEYKVPRVGKHLPGVYDAGLWSTDQMHAYARAALASTRTASEAGELLAALKPFADAYARVKPGVEPSAEYRAFLDSNTVTPAMKMGDFRRAYEAYRTASTDAASRGAAQGRITQSIEPPRYAYGDDGKVTFLNPMAPRDFAAADSAEVDVEAERKLFEAVERKRRSDLGKGFDFTRYEEYASPAVENRWQGWLAKARTQADAGKAGAAAHSAEGE